MYFIINCIFKYYLWVVSLLYNGLIEVCCEAPQTIMDVTIINYVKWNIILVQQH